MKKTFENMTPAQVIRLAKQNREKSQTESTSDDYSRRNVKKAKRRSHVYVDRSVDPSFIDADASTIFNEMKKRPHQ